MRLVSSLAPGEALPTVAQLAEGYHVARATVTRTLRVLEARSWPSGTAELGQVSSQFLVSRSDGVAPKQMRRTYVGSQAWSHPVASR